MCCYLFVSYIICNLFCYSLCDLFYFHRLGVDLVLILIIIRNANIAQFSTASTLNALYKTNKQIYTREATI